jgi:hypothetical protein
LYEIVKVCKEIASWTPEQILDFKRRVKPIVDHNFKVLTTNTSKIVADKIRAGVSKRLREEPKD